MLEASSTPTSDALEDAPTGITDRFFKSCFSCDPNNCRMAGFPANADGIVNHPDEIVPWIAAQH